MNFQHVNRHTLYDINGDLVTGHSLYGRLSIIYQTKFGPINYDILPYRLFRVT